jgi:hypothetical protein
MLCTWFYGRIEVWKSVKKDVVEIPEGARVRKAQEG